LTTHRKLYKERGRGMLSRDLIVLVQTTQKPAYAGFAAVT